MNKQDKEFNNILDRCLERVLAGETIESCLSDYPQQARELEPLLLTIASVKKACSVEPSVSFKERSKREFVTALREAKQPKSRLPILAFWTTRWAAIPLAVLSVLVVGVGTVAAARDSLPDQPLYPIKIATEKAMLQLPRSNTEKAELYATLADKRVQEIVVMADKGNAEQVKRVAEDLNSYLSEINALTATKKATTKAATPRAAAPAPTTASPRTAAPVAPKVAPSPQSADSQAQAPQAVAVPPPPSISKSVPRPAPAPSSVGAAGAGSASERKESATVTASRALPKSTVAKVTEREKLKAELKRKALENPAALRAVLRKASPSVRPELQKAIEIADERYRQALDNLEEAENGK